MSSEDPLHGDQTDTAALKLGVGIRVPGDPGADTAFGDAGGSVQPERADRHVERAVSAGFDHTDRATIHLARGLVEDVLGLAGAYNGEPTLLKVAEGMSRTARTLVTAMREQQDNGSGEN